MYSTFLIIVLSVWQLCVAHSWQPEDYSEMRPLSTKQLERLASWTEDDKQNKWELSGQFEGDIILPRGQRNIVTGENYRWPNKVVPYEIDSNYTLEQKNSIINALKEIPNKTCIKVRAKRSTDKDYVYFTGGKRGCSAVTGRRGGKQIVNLDALDKAGQGCLSSGIIVHEFLHALGMFHQHNAIGRDEYIEIVWTNIEAGQERNFRIHNKGQAINYGLPYDYNSIMHYSAYTFSKNKKKTIVTKDPNAIIGQRDGLSRIDILKLKKMYKCRN